jgi:hypothetical protein
MNEVEAGAEMARLKQLLQWEQNNHREFRQEIYSDPEFRVIFERRQRERSRRRDRRYALKSLWRSVKAVFGCLQ